MSERKWHVVVGSSAFKPGFGRFERGEAVIMIGALGFGMILFRLLTASVGWPTWTACVAAGAVPAGVGGFLGCYVIGKPRHYAVHMLTWRWMGLAGWLAAHGVPVTSKPLLEIEKNERK